MLRRALLTLPALALSSTAVAQDAIKMEIVRVGQTGQATPAFVVHPQAKLDELTVEVRCGGVSEKRSGTAAPGTPVRLELAVPEGAHSCSGRLSIRSSDGSEGEMPLNFKVQMHAPLKVQVPRDSVDLSGKTLSVVLDRNAKGVTVEVVGEGGAVIGHGNAGGGSWPAGQPIGVSWTDSGDEILQIRVVGTDVDGFWGQVDLSPWAYEVPHEDVVFESGKSIIRAGEEPKLEAALAEVRKIAEKYGSIAKINLYVAGHTDTVGSSQTNQSLSRDRARAIAKWYVSHGFEHPVYYQGFGEDGLAVATPDETDEAANRRAAYIVAAEPPPNLSQSWTRMK
jgi:outer membrane protein OmpA-like peptidoglycan-associated protein